MSTKNKGWFDQISSATKKGILNLKLKHRKSEIRRAYEANLDKYERQLLDLETSLFNAMESLVKAETGEKQGITQERLEAIGSFRKKIAIKKQTIEEENLNMKFALEEYEDMNLQGDEEDV